MHTHEEQRPPRQNRRLHLPLFLCLATLYFFFGAVTMLYASEPTRFTRISIEQGLSQSTVQVILQDKSGFIWLGTDEGLDRFDGYSFLVFKNDPQDLQSLDEDRISAPIEDCQPRH